jgi:hypothetical protein
VDTADRFDLQLGMAYAGGALTALTLVEALHHLLGDLQYAPGMTDASLDSVANTIAKFFRHVSAKFGEVLDKNAITTFALGGRCPVQKKVRVFSFRIVPSGSAMNAEFTEEDLDEPLVLGAGSDAARARLRAGGTPLEALKDVIEDNSVPSVGGTVQYGRFDEGFKLFSVQDYWTDLATREIHVGFFFRGIPFLDEPEEFMGSLFVPQTAILPFQARIKRHIEDGYAAINA